MTLDEIQGVFKEEEFIGIFQLTDAHDNEFKCMVFHNTKEGKIEIWNIKDEDNVEPLIKNCKTIQIAFREFFRHYFDTQ